MFVSVWKCITLFFVAVSVRQFSANSAVTLDSCSFMCCSCGSDLVSGTWRSLYRLLCHKLRRPFVNDGSSQ